MPFRRFLSILISLIWVIQGSVSFAISDIGLIDLYRGTQIHFTAEDDTLVNKTIESFGLEAIQLSSDDFEDGFASVKNILIQGNHLELTESDVAALKSFVNQGGQLSIWGSVSLAEAFDFTFGNMVFVSGAIESLNGQLEINWPNPVQRRPLVNEDELSIFTIFSDAKGIAVAGKPYGLGKVFFSTDIFYSYESHNIILFPYLMNNMADFFEMSPMKRIDEVRVYMDWGFYYDKSPNAIVATLVDAGVSEVHLSAWYDTERIRSFYEAFISQCHANGILVYAWFELPMVTQEFWDASESVRQKNAFGEYAVVGWRSLVALEDPWVNELVQMEVLKILDSFNWDGANLAELYYEPASGFYYVDDITPFSDYFLRDFIEEHGADPTGIFTGDSSLSYTDQQKIIDAYIDERIDLITNLNVQYIQLFERQFPELDLYITLIDDSVDPQITPNIGSNSALIMSRLEGTKLKLQIEDPFYLWSDQSHRYLDIGEHFGSLYPEHFESIDINIVERDEAFPTAKQTGVEYNLVLYDGAANKSNVHLYALNTVSEIDLNRSPYTLGSYVNINPFKDNLLVDSPMRYKIEGNFSEFNIFRNNMLWPFRTDTSIALPKGYSLLSIQDKSMTTDSTPYVTNVTMDIDDYKLLDDTIEIKYSSNRICYLSTATSIERILVDGQNANLNMYFNGEDFTVSLPQGTHTLELKWSQDQSTLLSLNGLVSSTALKSTVVDSTEYYKASDLLDFIGSNFEYHEEFRTLSASLGNHAFWLQADNSNGLVDGQAFYMNETARFIDGALYIPLPFVLDVFHLNATSKKNVINIFTE